MADDLDDAMLENAKGPAQASDETGAFQNHSIPDQIALARFRKSQAAARRGFSSGVRNQKLVPPGA